ncbi:MarR family transcriptional regulator [Bosea caraganae]|nr:MarR family transcriptional regulator [Bosea caraganae]
MRELKIHVEDTGEFFRRAADLARRLDAGERELSEAHLSFDGLDLLLRTMTHNRWALLRSLRQRGASSIRALAAALGRDYKAVHSDVTALIEAGLIERDQAGLISVPWSRISAELDLAAA